MVTKTRDQPNPQSTAMQPSPAPPAKSTVGLASPNRPRKLMAMHLRRPILALIIAGLLAPAPLALAEAPEASIATAAAQKFGPYEALTYDATMLAGVKVDKVGDVFILLQPDKINAQITIKISMQKGAAYRKWFTGDEVLVAQQNDAGRSPGVWSDRVQTSAKYIEYWADGKCFLHLMKTDS